MKLEELHEAKLPARSLSKQIVDELIKMGFRVDERETTSGALKTWLSSSSDVDLKKITVELSKKFPDTKFDKSKINSVPDQVRGDGYVIEAQGKQSLFLAVYSGAKAKDYKLGMDV